MGNGGSERPQYEQASKELLLNYIVKQLLIHIKQRPVEQSIEIELDVKQAIEEGEKNRMNFLNTVDRAVALAFTNSGEECSAYLMTASVSIEVELDAGHKEHVHCQFLCWRRL